jgi:hypothetical protein
MSRFRAGFASLACACVCVLAACNDAPTETPKGAAVGDKPLPPKTVDVTKEMVAAVSAGKVATAISVHFSLRASPVANTPLPVDVAIVPHQKFSVVRVYFESHDGLSITSGGQFEPANSGSVETPLRHQVMLLPSKEGLFMMTATVETVGEDGNVTRVFSIPVIVAAAPGAAPATEPPATPADTAANAPASAPARN